MSNLPWNERVPAISVNPEMATIEDIAHLAAESMEASQMLLRLKNALAKIVAQTEAWNDEVQDLLGRHPQTGIELKTAKELIKEADKILEEQNESETKDE